MTQRAIVPDANILIRAVLGEQVRRLITAHIGTVSVFAPEAAYAEARKHLPAVLAKRGGNAEAAMTVLDALEALAFRWMPSFTRASKSKPWRASGSGIPTIGLRWLARCY